MPKDQLGKRPLDGLRVLDLGNHLAGPLAALLLADQGADVLHIDSPRAGAPSDALDAVLQRNKRRETIDLKTKQGIEKFRALLSGADVLIENFAPGVMDRLGFGYDECRQSNPHLIYLSLPAIAAEDESLPRLEGWEPLIGAITGLFTNISFTRDFLGLPPVYSALRLPSVYAAVHGATAIMMSLVNRPSGGERIEVPLAAAMMSAMGATALSYAEQPERYDLPPVSRAFKTTQLPALKAKFASLGSEGVMQALAMASALTPPMMASYECADGRFVYVFAMDHARMSKTLLLQLGLMPKFKNKLQERDAYAVVSSQDNLSDVGTLSKELKDEIRAAMTQAFRSRPAAEWERLLSEAGVPCAMVRTTSEWLVEKHVREASLAVEVQDPALGSMVQPGPSVWLSGASAALLKPRPRQRAGSELDWAPRDHSWSIRPAPEKTSATCLSGVRVLDLSTMIAGPACGRTLAEYGADVIKVDPVHPLLGPRMSIWYSPELNQGKASVLLDLKSAGGREALLRLVEGADVLVHNMRPGVLDRLGLTEAELDRRRPGLVVTSITAYKGPTDGPWSTWPGFDPVVQAASGVAARYGSPDKPEIHAVASTIDYLTGYLAAFGTAVALASGGSFKRVSTSLAQASMLAQLPYSVACSGKEAREPSGQLAMGEAPRSQLYKASDAWIYLFSPDERAWARFLEHLQTAQHTREDQVRYWIQARTAADVLGVAARYGVSGTTVQTLEEVLRSRTFPRDSEGFVQASRHTFAALIDSSHASGTSVRTLAPLYARLRNRPIRLARASERHGTSTATLLQSAGLTPSEVSQLLSTGAAAEKLSPVYLPG